MTHNMSSRYLFQLSRLCYLSIVISMLPNSALALGTAPGDIAAYIVGLRGEVEVNVVQRSEDGRSLGRKWIPAKRGYALRLKDSIRTGRGRVRFQFTDRNEPANSGPSIFNLGDNTEVHLADYSVKFDHGYTEGQALLDLIRGTIRNFIKGWGSDSGFSVRAGVAVCGVRGTDFTVFYEPHEEAVEVQVHEGKVVLTGPGGSRLIKTGQRALMVNGAFPEKPPT